MNMARAGAKVWMDPYYWERRHPYYQERRVPYWPGTRAPLNCLARQGGFVPSNFPNSKSFGLLLTARHLAELWTRDYRTSDRFATALTSSCRASSGVCGHDGRPARGGPTDHTLVRLTWREKRIEHRIRFGASSTNSVSTAIDASSVSCPEYLRLRPLGGQ